MNSTFGNSLKQMPNVVLLFHFQVSMTDEVKEEVWLMNLFASSSLFRSFAHSECSQAVRSSLISCDFSLDWMYINMDDEMTSSSMKISSITDYKWTFDLLRTITTRRVQQWYWSQLIQMHWTDWRLVDVVVLIDDDDDDDDVSVKGWFNAKDKCQLINRNCPGVVSAKRRRKNEGKKKKTRQTCLE